MSEQLPGVLMALALIGTVGAVVGIIAAPLSTFFSARDVRRAQLMLMSEQAGLKIQRLKRDLEIELTVNKIHELRRMIEREPLLWDANRLRQELKSEMAVFNAAEQRLNAAEQRLNPAEQRLADFIPEKEMRRRWDSLTETSILNPDISRQQWGASFLVIFGGSGTLYVLWLSITVWDYPVLTLRMVLTLILLLGLVWCLPVAALYLGRLVAGMLIRFLHSRQ